MKKPLTKVAARNETPRPRLCPKTPPPPLKAR